MENGGEKGSVCVTGGAGYLASWLIMRLLENGYSVRATARLDPKFNEDVTHLKAFPRASEKLQIFDADLNKPDSFNDVIEGCVGVFHVAHPIDLEGKRPEALVTKTAVDGALGILKACLQAKTVKKVVYSSSMAAAVISKLNVQEIDESQWTDVDFCRTLDVPGISYVISKTVTERESIKFAKEHGLQLVTMLPALIVGPFSSPRIPESVAIALSLFNGDPEKPLPAWNTNLVHVDDVVAAQIFLFESPKAEGRYVCCSTNTTVPELAKFITGKYPELKVRPELLSDVSSENIVRLSSNKLLGLGFEFKHGLEGIFDGAIQCCKEKNLLGLIITCKQGEISSIG